jgi:hypothetical protein
MAGVVGFIEVTGGHGTKMKVTKENGVNVPHHIIESVQSEDAYYTDAILLTQNVVTALADETIETKQVFVRADADNSDYVYILGDTEETTKGYQLSAGETIPIVIDDVSKINVLATAAGQTVRYIAS